MSNPSSPSVPQNSCASHTGSRTEVYHNGGGSASSVTPSAADQMTSSIGSTPRKKRQKHIDRVVECEFIPDLTHVLQCVAESAYVQIC